MASSTMDVNSSVSGAGRESKAIDLRRRLDFFCLRLAPPPARPRFDSKSRMSSMSCERGQLCADVHQPCDAKFS